MQWTQLIPTGMIMRKKDILNMKHTAPIRDNYEKQRNNIRKEQEKCRKCSTWLPSKIANFVAQKSAFNKIG